ncbi:nuclear transport factor 2 family protein [Sphingobium sp. CR2-8]|uniref:nuclear transport factor 2 family protein n=1 Tax=Sphingobium sp. CR2-8 TaxID=1306534 RepID=UPI002DC00372|nr:nuclear transport factor 2 family protein [Sphingobium sp. CR2-8]MEC3911893.1 nuclear transport factor 2 family protein [Sphingobium sp. CR2-8]
MTDPLAIAEALSAAITSCDVAAVERLYTDDTVVWHSYDRVEQGRVETLAFLSAFFEKAAEVRYTDVRRVRTEDGYVQQHVIHTTLKTGEAFEPRPVCIVARLRDDKIVRIDEYLEARRPAAVQEGTR